jgi:hypothetical protein
VPGGRGEVTPMNATRVLPHPDPLRGIQNSKFQKKLTPESLSHCGISPTQYCVGFEIYLLRQAGGQGMQGRKKELIRAVLIPH